MAPTRRSDPPNMNAFNSGPSQTACPSRVTAGKGGHVAQLQKTAFVIEQTQHASQSKDLLHDEPINKTAPTLRRPRKKKTGKKPAKDAAMVDDVDSDPFSSDSQPIAKSGPDGHFGLQPRSSGFVGRQTLQDYEKDHPKNGPVVRPGNGGVHHKARPPTDSNDGGNCMAIDNEGLHGHRSEVRDHDHQMDVDNGQDQLPSYGNNNRSRRQDVIRGQDYRSARENRKDQIMHDLALQDDIRVQPPHHRAQQAPPQPSNLSRHSLARDSTQLRRHVSNTEQLQERALPSPPISRSNSDRGDKHDHNNGTQVSSAVRRGDEHADTDYDLLGCNHSSNPRRKSPKPEYLASVRDGTRMSRGSLVRADARREYGIPSAQRERVATGTISQPNQVPVVQRNHVAAPPLRAQNDNAAAANEVPAARQLQGPVERNHAASSNLATEGGESLAAVATHQSVLVVPEQGPGHHGRYSKNPKDAVEAKPWHIGYYPLLWTQLLETAKAEMQRSLFRQHPFPPDKRKAVGVEGECYEVLLSVLTRYEREQMPVERGYDDKRHDMATLLYDDLSLFRSVIKKTAQEAIASGYPVHTLTTVIPWEARMAAVKEQVTSLLQDANYLHEVPDEHGKRAYFGHPVLRQICLSVFYANSRKSLHTFPEFQQSVPVKALALVAATVHFVLTAYKKHGRDTNPSLNAKELEASYYRFLQSLQGVMRHHSKGPRLEKMLTDWAYDGMDGYLNVNGDDDDIDGGEFSMLISDSESELGLANGGEQADKQLGDMQMDEHPVDKDSGNEGSGDQRLNNDGSDDVKSDDKESGDEGSGNEESSDEESGDEESGNEESGNESEDEPELVS